MSKTFRLVAARPRGRRGERGLRVRPARPQPSHRASTARQILPCKACVSTAMPLCHWPCSCYPNHAMGQVNDWMNEIYPRWVAAHGVHDRDAGLLVPGAERAEADDRPAGVRRRRQPRSRPPPTARIRGGQGARARGLGLSRATWRGAPSRVVVHGDAAGAETLRRALTDWLLDMELVQAGGMRHARPLRRLLRAVRHAATTPSTATTRSRRKSATRRAAWSTPCA